MKLQGLNGRKATATTTALGGVLLAATLGAATPASAASDDLIAAAREEGTVTWYTSMIVDQVVRPMVAAFEEKYPGVSVEFSRAGGSDQALKLINEGQAGRVMGDVFDSVAAYTPLKAADLVAAYTPDSAAALPADFRDPDGFWTAPNVYYLSAAYNTDIVAAEDAPKTFEDLLDPKWKDQIVWSVLPQESAAPGFVGNVLMSMGDDKGMAYLEKLAGQEITNMDTSQRAVLDRVISGDFAIGLMTYTHHSPISAAKGAPVDWIPMSPVISSPNTVGLVKGAPHPNAGKLLIDFIVSPEGQQILADAMYLPTSPEVKAQVPDLLPGEPRPFTTTMMTPKAVTPKIAEWIEIERKLFE